MKGVAPQGLAPTFLVTLVLCLAPSAGVGGEVSRLHRGAVEIGLAGFEVEVGYNHQQAFDSVDLEGSVSWQRAVGANPIYPFASIGGGLRQENLGSFSQARCPVGFALGVRALFGARAAVRIEYRYRHVVNDPVANFTEHQALTGISLVLRNSARPERGEEKGP